MCEPVTIAYAAFAIAVVGEGVSYYNQSQQAKQQEAGLKDDAALNEEALKRQQAQVLQQSTDQQSEQATKARQQIALLSTINGEYGGGNTANRSMAVAGVQAGQDLATIKDNRDNNLAEIGFDSQANTIHTRDQLSSISRPSLLASGLRIASSAASTASTYETQQQAAAANARRGAQ